MKPKNSRFFRTIDFCNNSCPRIAVTGLTCLAVSAIALSSSAFANPFTWADSAVNTDWYDNVSWVGGTAPANDSTTDNAIFTSVSNAQPTLNQQTGISGVDFQMAGGGLAMTGNNNLFQPGVDGINSTGQTSGTNTITNANIFLVGSSTWNLFSTVDSASTSTFTFDSVLQLNGKTLTIVGQRDSAAGNVGIINFDRSITQAGNLTISSLSANNTVNLNAANTYTGLTKGTAGIVNVAGDQSAANGGWTIETPNVTPTPPVATVNFLVGSTVAVASTKKIQIGRAASSGAAVAATLNVSGTVNNAGTLEMVRAGILNLNSGAVWNQAGDMLITPRGGVDAPVNVNAGAEMTYTGSNTVKLNAAVLSSGKCRLTVDGTGLFSSKTGFENTVNNTTSGFGRVTLTNGGTLKLGDHVVALTTETQFELGSGGGVIDNNGFDATLEGAVSTGYGPVTTGIFGAGGLTSKGNGTLTLTGVNTYTGDTTVTGGMLSTGFLANSGYTSGIGKGTLILDGGTLKYTGGDIGFWTRNLTIGPNGASFDLSEATGNLTINGTIAFSGSGDHSLTITTGSPGGRLNSGFGDNGGASTLVKKGGGKLLMTSGSNSYTGQLQILSGSVQYGNNSRGGPSTGVGHSVAISSGSSLSFRHAGTDVVTYDAPISGDGSVSMICNNATSGGSLTLGGNNTFTGGLTLDPFSGTNVLPLKAGGPSALGTGKVSIGQYGKLDLNGYSNTTGLLVSIHNAATVTNDGPTDATLTLSGTATQTYGGAILDGPTNKVSIVKSGTGTQNLIGSNSYSGDTTVSGGTLSLGQVNPNNESSTVTIASNSVLDLAFTGTDAVDKLFINGTQQPAGDYTNAHPSGAISGGGTLHVASGPSGYNTWADANAPGQTVDMDHDSDGMKNGIEYFMGLSGSDFTANPAPDANYLVTWPMGTNYSGAYGTDYVIQTSPDLESWSDVLESGVTIASGVSVSYTVTGPGPQFVRLVVWPN